MPYNPRSVIESYEKNAEIEDESEKGTSLRVEIPREFIKKYLKASDVVLDAGGGTGVNAIMMAKHCRKVTLLDITPRILQFAERNVAEAEMSDRIALVNGDITDLSQFQGGEFTFVVCVGDAISYVLERRFKAIEELVRVAQKGSILIIGCDSKLGFTRMNLAKGQLDEAIEVYETSECYCGMGPRTHLYIVDEMTALLKRQGCNVLEVASTPTFADTIDASIYSEKEKWERLKGLELEVCTSPELLGMGLHLLFVARKEGLYADSRGAPSRYYFERYVLDIAIATLEKSGVASKPETYEFLPPVDSWSFPKYPQRTAILPPDVDLVAIRFS